MQTIAPQMDIILTGIKAQNISQAYIYIAQKISLETAISPRIIFDELMQKENLASSSIGDGIALPHLKLSQLRHPITILATLEEPIYYSSLESDPIEMICIVLSPAKISMGEHLQRLSSITRFLRDADIRKKIMSAADEDTMRSLMVGPESWMLAA